MVYKNHDLSFKAALWNLRQKSKYHKLIRQNISNLEKQTFFKKCIRQFLINSPIKMLTLDNESYQAIKIKKGGNRRRRCHLLIFRFLWPLSSLESFYDRYRMNEFNCQTCTLHPHYSSSVKARVRSTPKTIHRDNKVKTFQLVVHFLTSLGLDWQS